jgi:predicted ArsR family transcriptional regulator
VTPKRAPARAVRDPEPRKLTDAREMRAIAHPARVAILEALMREGPLTATEAAELVGESPANCSFHLRTLAKYGFVEEAEGGTGRSRPWRRVALGTSFTEVHDDSETAIAAHALAGLSQRRANERFAEWNENRRSFTKAWQQSAFFDQMLVYVTAEELDAIEEELLAVVNRYRDRVVDPATRPKDSLPVSIVSWGHPLEPSPSGN